MTKYSLTKDPSAIKLSVSKNSTAQVELTKNPGFARAYLTKDPGGAVVSISKNYSVPVTYNAEVYGDSLADGSTGYIGSAVGNYTSQAYTLDVEGVAGENLGAIKTRFLAAFPDTTNNVVILQGGINNIWGGGGQTNLATMKTDMAAMADAVLADARFELIIVNVTPWKGFATWTAPLQTQTDDYNAWLAATYPAYVVDAYSALEDGATPDTLLGEFYKVSTGDVHPNKAGDKIIDELIGSKLFDTNADLTEPAGNLFAAYRDFSSWVFQDSTLGSNSITLADNTTGTGNAIVPIADAAAQHRTQQVTTSSPANNAV